jgi:hypothetical protein
VTSLQLAGANLVVANVPALVPLCGRIREPDSPSLPHLALRGGKFIKNSRIAARTPADSP